MQSCRNIKIQCVFRLILSSALVYLCPLSVRANESVTLVWSPSSDPGVAGYRIYYGAASQSYTNCTDVGMATNVTIVLPSTGGTYYFAAADYDASGVQSDFSNEAIFTVPAAARLTPAMLSAGQFAFTVSGTAGCNYVVQVSTNLSNWSPMATNVPPFTFVDPNASNFSRRFYRAVAYP